MRIILLSIVLHVLRTRVIVIRDLAFMSSLRSSSLPELQSSSFHTFTQEQRNRQKEKLYLPNDFSLSPLPNALLDVPPVTLLIREIRGFAIFYYFFKLGPLLLQ